MLLGRQAKVLSKGQLGGALGFLANTRNLFARWYEVLGFQGCSSHSGRRTFITNAARKISTVDGSLRDVQMLAGHANLRTTQRYIEPNASAQTRVVQLI